MFRIGKYMILVGGELPLSKIYDVKLNASVKVYKINHEAMLEETAKEALPKSHRVQQFPMGMVRQGLASKRSGQEGTEKVEDVAIIPNSIFDEEDKHRRSKNKGRTSKKVQPKLPKNMCVNIKVLYNKPFKKAIGKTDPKKLFDNVIKHCNKNFKLKGLRTNVKVTMMGKPKYVGGKEASEWSSALNVKKLKPYTKHIKNDPKVHSFVFFTIRRSETKEPQGIAYLASACMELESKDRMYGVKHNCLPQQCRHFDLCVTFVG